MTAIHPAFERMLLSDEGERLPNDGSLKAALSPEHTTSLSLARFLAAGCLARLNPGLSSVSVWDPAVGSGSLDTSLLKP